MAITGNSAAQTTLGICVNDANCGTAKSGRAVKIGIAEAFRCPECQSPLRAEEPKAGLPLPLIAAAGLAVLGLAGGGAYFLMRPAAPVAPPVTAAPAPAAAQDAGWTQEISRAAAAADAALKAQQAAERDASARADAARLEAEKLAAEQRDAQLKADAAVTEEKAAAEKILAEKQAALADAQKAADKAASLAAQRKAELAAGQARQKAAMEAAAAARQTGAAPAAAPAAAPDTAQDNSTADTDSGAVSHPFIAHAVAGGAPDYPDELTGSHKNGSARVRCTITEKGVPTNCDVVSSEGSSKFGVAVLRWLHSGRVRYVPATRNGVPVAETHEWSVDFAAPLGSNDNDQ
jgi:TonB family protein